MAKARIRPDFKRFAALQSEPAKGSLDPNRGKEQLPAEGSDEDKAETTPSISQYQDPRDRLDHERHLNRARALAGEVTISGS